MTIFNGIFVYLLIWWIILFCTLPMDIQSIGKPTDGNMPGAPLKHGLKKKVILTTAISCVVWLGVFLIIRYGGISFHDIAAKMPM